MFFLTADRSSRPPCAPYEEELIDGENAILVKPDNSETFAEGIRRVIDQPELGRKIASWALEAAPSFFWQERIGK